jgi:hypothetical protein
MSFKILKFSNRPSISHFPEQSTLAFENISEQLCSRTLSNTHKPLLTTPWPIRVDTQATPNPIHAFDSLNCSLEAHALNIYNKTKNSCQKKYKTAKKMKPQKFKKYKKYKKT